MHNDKTRISANEINRYVYCNYQWYYRRRYGDKELTKLKREYNKALKIKKDSRVHAFEKGNQFHKNFHKGYKVKKTIYLMLILIIPLIGLYFLKGF